MIRKMLVIAAAVAMPAAAMAGVTAIGGAGIASAKALTPVAATCTLTGNVTFANPGLSYNGSLTNKSVEDSKTDITPGGGGACPTKAIKEKIVTDTTACATASPAPACTLATAKTLAKDPFYYDTASSLASAGTANIAASLAGGIATTNNGTKVVLEVTAPNVTSILPGGACGTNIGFSLTGAVDLAAGGSTGLNYALDICLTGDTGTGSSGSFFPDYLAAAGGSTTVTIASGILGSSSSLVFS